jgi:hypothetical protein
MSIGHVKTHLSVRMIRLQNHWTDLDEIWYGLDVIGCTRPLDVAAPSWWEEGRKVVAEAGVVPRRVRRV